MSTSGNPVNEGSSLTLNGSFTDPNAGDTHTVVINWGDGTSNSTLSLTPGARTFSATRQFTDDNPTGSPANIYTLSATVRDNQNASASNTTTVAVNNVAPSWQQATPSPATLSVGASVTLTGNFTDPGTPDTHSVVVNWGDGSAATTVNLGPGVVTLQTTHLYMASGNRTITLTATDDDTGSATTSTSVVVAAPTPTPTPTPTPSITVLPGALVFNATGGVATPSSINVTVTTSNGASWSSSDTCGFFNASPTSGASGTTTRLTAANIPSFSPGTYTCPIVFSASGLPNKTVSVTLNVTTSSPTPTPTPPPAPTPTPPPPP